MSDNIHDRGLMLVGAASLFSLLFTFGTDRNVNFVDVEGWGLAVFAVLGAVALAAGVTGQAKLGYLAAAGYLVAALLVFVEIASAFELTILNGEGNTMGVLLGFGMAAGLLAYLRDTEETHRS